MFNLNNFIVENQNAFLQMFTGLERQIAGVTVADIAGTYVAGRYVKCQMRDGNIRQIPGAHVAIIRERLAAGEKPEQISLRMGPDGETMFVDSPSKGAFQNIQVQQPVQPPVQQQGPQFTPIG